MGGHPKKDEEVPQQCIPPVAATLNDGNEATKVKLKNFKQRVTSKSYLRFHYPGNYLFFGITKKDLLFEQVHALSLEHVTLLHAVFLFYFLFFFLLFFILHYVLTSCWCHMG
jgi:hypothetical protein